MRLFVAIELSDAIRGTLAQAQAHLKYAGADVKWVSEKSIHLTLKFLGEVPEEKLETIKNILDEIGKSTKSFEISLKDIGAFPKIDYPRVVWVGLDKGAQESKTLAEKIDEELSKVGFTRDSRPFAAHLTIGRVRSSKNKEALKDKITHYTLHITHPETVTHLTLFKSALTPSGPIYTKLHEARFSD
jgi:2'-5' RNA ligase